MVIGSGFGGLAAAIRLGARGYRVTVLERLEAPGGRASVFRQDGFTFDAGPTIITAPFLFEELWTLCGRRMGEAFQVADDVLDAASSEERIGKPVGRDAALGRPSAVREMGLRGAIRHLQQLVQNAIDAVPACSGAEGLRAVLAVEARRLLPQDIVACAA